MGHSAIRFWFRIGFRIGFRLYSDAWIWQVVLVVSKTRPRAV